MFAMFHIGCKILFDGYLTIGLLLNQMALIIKHFLFDGYLMVTVNNSKFLCNHHVTGRWFSNSKSLIIKHSVYTSYVTESCFTPKVSPSQDRIKSGTLSVLFRYFLTAFTQRQ